MHNIIVFEISIHAPPRGATSHGMPCLTSKSISIHAPPRGATRRCDERLEAHPISIHAPPRGATDSYIYMPLFILYFNSRPSARGDAHSAAVRCFSAAFQFTPLREGRPPGKCGTPSRAAFQFTPLREGRHARHVGIEPTYYFNSRPSARGDITGGFITDDDGTFQFTPLREGRPPGTSALSRRTISIHAPPRGATVGKRRNSTYTPFQFTPLREGRPARIFTCWRTAKFQFTPLREGRRLCWKSEKRLPMHFNSRPSARGDITALLEQARDKISIHAPPRGATTRKAHGIAYRVFQFTPLREGRRLEHARAVVVLIISIHAPPRGATDVHGYGHW